MVWLKNFGSVKEVWLNCNIKMNMDQFVSKLRNTVSQVAYQVNSSVSTIIPGNPIHREYETLKLRCTYGCPGFVWAVHDAVKRESASLKASLKDAIGPNMLPAATPNQTSSTDLDNQLTDKTLYSVFVFDKSQLDAVQNKADRERVLEHLKKGITQLTRLRHPSVLVVHHPIEESRSSLAFVAEHVYGNLDSILKEQRSTRIEEKVTKDLVDLSQDLGPKDSDYRNNGCQLDELQIKAGLLQLCDGLKFLHSAKMLHRNLCLENIFVDSNNTWKIAGFDFSCRAQTGPTGNTSSQATENLQIVEYDPVVRNLPTFPSLKTIYNDLPTSILPNWSCTAPEQSNSDQVSFPSDVYSLGILSCALLGQDSDMVDLSYEYGLMSDTYRRGIKFRELADRLSPSYKTSVMKFAAINVDSRPSLDDFENLALFKDYQVQAIRDLDSQFAWDRLRKIDFFNRLRDILPKLSHQVKVNRVAQSLVRELINMDMLPYVLPNILIIAKDCTPTEFKFKIFPHLKAPFRVLEPKSVPLMLLDNLVVLADRSKLCLPDFQTSAFTLIQYLLKSDQQMQEKCLNVLPTVKKFIDDKSMTSMILPEIGNLIKTTLMQTIRVKALDSLGSMVDSMEKGIVERQVLTMVFEIPTKEPEVIVASTSVIKRIVHESKVDLTKELIAIRILPFLIPLTAEKDLNLQQFDALMILIKKLMDRVEREQREVLGRRHQASTQKSSALILDNNTFKGSNHFQLIN